MRDKTRRSICRLAFCMLCLLPTAGIGGLILYRSTPVYAAAERVYWQHLLHAHTGLTARVGSVRRPRRGDVLLDQVTLTDPDSGRRLARVRLVEMAWTDHGLVMLLSQPEIEAGQFQRLWSLFHHRVLRAGELPMAVQLSAAELTLHATPHALTFTEVRCTAESSAKITKTLIEFRVAGAEMTSPAQLQIVRGREVYPPVTGWRLRTGPTPLPCSLFAGYCRPLERLGSDCRFHGTIWAEETTQGWDGEIAGRFDQVDLQALMDPFPHKLSGMAEIVFNQATFRGSRLQDVAGSLIAHGGVISTSLVTRLGDVFQLPVDSGLEESQEPLHAYQQLAVGFQLDADGMHISGLCDTATTGALLVGPEGTMLSDSLHAVVPAVALAQALSPDADLQVPATKETHLLLRALPLPGVRPSAPLTAKKRYTRLRLKK
ncbi:MAG: hypothetical protein ACC628_13650 [Pirellulaceae bacterium]